ncbi:MAG TPA: hypothetical protein VEC16_01180, partial [Alphaproteobacteria bacterium]|nr:hypothetical protein [Alphaproteobacteria bacterium]
HMIEQLLLGNKDTKFLDGRIFTPLEAEENYSKLGYLFLPNGLFAQPAIVGSESSPIKYMKLNLKYLFDSVTGLEYDTCQIDPSIISGIYVFGDSLMKDSIEYEEKKPRKASKNFFKDTLAHSLDFLHTTQKPQPPSEAGLYVFLNTPYNFNATIIFGESHEEVNTGISESLRMRGGGMRVHVKNFESIRDDINKYSEKCPNNQLLIEALDYYDKPLIEALSGVPIFYNKEKMKKIYDVIPVQPNDHLKCNWHLITTHKGNQFYTAIVK